MDLAVLAVLALEEAEHRGQRHEVGKLRAEIADLLLERRAATRPFEATVLGHPWCVGRAVVRDLLGRLELTRTQYWEFWPRRRPR